MTKNSESGHASTKNVFSLKKNLAIIRIIQGIGYVYTKQNSRSQPILSTQSLAGPHGLSDIKIIINNKHIFLKDSLLKDLTWQDRDDHS